MSELQKPQPGGVGRLSRIARHKMLLLMLGGAIGTVARYELGRWISSAEWVQNSGFPLGTFVINVTGSFVLGATMVAIGHISTDTGQDVRFLIAIGFCGGYTTFSSFEWETYTLVRDGSWRMAIAYVVSSVIAGFVGVIAAVMFMRALLPGK
jgi:CrcB protein